MNSEQNLTREEAIAILNTPDEQLNELIERAGALRKKYKGNHVSIHLLTNARSGNCSQNCAYCAQSKAYTPKNNVKYLFYIHLLSPISFFFFCFNSMVYMTFFLSAHSPMLYRIYLVGNSHRRLSV